MSYIKIILRPFSFAIKVTATICLLQFSISRLAFLACPFAFFLDGMAEWREVKERIVELQCSMGLLVDLQNTNFRVKRKTFRCLLRVIVNLTCNSSQTHGTYCNSLSSCGHHVVLMVGVQTSKILSIH